MQPSKRFTKYENARYFIETIAGVRPEQDIEDKHFSYKEFLEFILTDKKMDEYFKQRYSVLEEPTILGTALIGAQTTTKQKIYTVPTGKNFIPDSVLIYGITATLAGLTDMDIGGDATASNWLQQISLNAFTATTDYARIMQPDQAAGPPIVPVKIPYFASGVEFGLKIITISTGAANFFASVTGTLFDA
jgi:hypothetical protein